MSAMFLVLVFSFILFYLWALFGVWVKGRSNFPIPRQLCALFNKLFVYLISNEHTRSFFFWGGGVNNPFTVGRACATHTQAPHDSS